MYTFPSNVKELMTKEALKSKYFEKEAIVAMFDKLFKRGRRRLAGESFRRILTVRTEESRF